MASTRVAQIGQVGINQPIFEVLVNGKKYAFVVNKKSRMEFVTPQFLKSIGVYSNVADQYQIAVDADIRNALTLDSASTTTYPDARFPYLQQGSGLVFVSDFKLHMGWKNFNPINSIVS